MRKQIAFVLIVCLIASLIMACGKTEYPDVILPDGTEFYDNGNEKHIDGSDAQEMTDVDDAFLKDLVMGWGARWDFVESDDFPTTDSQDPQYNADKIKEAYITAIDFELERIAKYNELEFGSRMLQEKAEYYISLLRDSKGALQYIGVDDTKYKEEWDTAYKKRYVAIIDFIDTYQLEIDEEYASAVENIRVSADGVKAEDELKAMLANGEYSFEDLVHSADYIVGWDVSVDASYSTPISPGSYTELFNMNEIEVFADLIVVTPSDEYELDLLAGSKTWHRAYVASDIVRIHGTFAGLASTSYGKLPIIVVDDANDFELVG